ALEPGGFPALGGAKQGPIQLLARLELAERREGHAEIPVEGRHLPVLLLQIDRIGDLMQAGQHLLTFAQAVAEKHRCDLVLERAATELPDLAYDFLGARKPVTGAPEG